MDNTYSLTDECHQLDVTDLCLSLLKRLDPAVCTAKRRVVALGGSVAVGKSTLSEQLAGALRSHGFETSVVSTDGFLLPNRVLSPLGLAFVKGLPHTYDWFRLRQFLAAARDSMATVKVPIYSHVSFDADGSRSLAPGQILIIEGVNALHSLIAEPSASSTSGVSGVPSVSAGTGSGRSVDLSIYVEAEFETIAGWYIERFVRLIKEAECDPSSFYARFVVFNENERIEVARSVWDTINLPNLEHHIAPTQANADVIVRLNTDHTLQEIVWP